jgi:hypothetical protein
MIEDLVKDLKEISTGKDEFDLRFIRPKKASAVPSVPQKSQRPVQEPQEEPGPILGAYRRLNEQGRFWDRDMTGKPLNVTPFEHDPDVVSCIEQPQNSTPSRRCYKVMDRFGNWSERFVDVVEEPPQRPAVVSSLGQRVLREAQEAIRPHLDDIIAPFRELFGEPNPVAEQIPLDFRPGGLSRPPGVELELDIVEESEIIDAVVTEDELVKEERLACDDEICLRHPVPGRTHSWVNGRAPGQYGQQYCTWCGFLRQ